MSESLVFWVGNRSPSITETILNDDGTPHDLTGQTVAFQAREAGASTLLVNQTATIVHPPGVDGMVQYDWQAADIAANGILSQARSAVLEWWQVTTTANGFKQDMMEAIFEVRAHSNAQVYVELEQLKSTPELTNTTFADKDLELGAQAATRCMEESTHRRFWLDTGTANVRYYSPESLRLLPIDDLVTLTTVAIDRGGSGIYTELWTNGTDFVLEPFNAPNEIPARPFEMLRVRSLAGRWFPTYVEKSVQVTGQFGWLQVPSPIVAATTVLAEQIVKRMRESPTGVAAMGLDGLAIRVARSDPFISSVIDYYTRMVPLA